MGGEIQAQLDTVKMGKGKNASERREKKQQELLKRLLYGNEPQKTEGRFRDPAMLLKPQKGGD